MMNRIAASMICVLITAGFAMAEVGVGVDINTPNVRVQVGTPPQSYMTVVERERVIVRGKEGMIGKKGHGRHTGQYKKQKKHDRRD